MSRKLTVVIDATDEIAEMILSLKGLKVEEGDVLSEADNMKKQITDLQIEVEELLDSLESEGVQVYWENLSWERHGV